MCGNVRDWCLDVFETRRPTLPPMSLFDPSAQPEGDEKSLRVFRGGDWYSLPRQADAVTTFGNDPYLRDTVIGFRLARPLPAHPGGGA